MRPSKYNEYIFEVKDRAEEEINKWTSRGIKVTPALFEVAMAHDRFFPKETPFPFQNVLPRVNRPLASYLEHVLRLYNKGSIDDFVTPALKDLLNNLDSFEGCFKAVPSPDKMTPNCSMGYVELSAEDRQSFKQQLATEDCSICLEPLEGQANVTNEDREEDEEEEKDDDEEEDEKDGGDDENDGGGPVFGGESSGIEEGDEKVVKMRSCTHIYHQGCVEVWLRSSSMCPYCKVS